MKRALSFMLGAIVVTTSTCVDRDTGPGNLAVVTRDSAGVQVVANGGGSPTPAWRISGEPLLVIGGDESNPGTQLYRAGSAKRLPGGDVAVGNSGTLEVLVFGLTGERRATLGGAGEGPAEFGGFGVSVVAVTPTGEVFAEGLGSTPKLVKFREDGSVEHVSVAPSKVVPRGGVWSDRATSPAGTSFRLGEPLYQLSGHPSSSVDRGRGFVVRFTYQGAGPDTIGRYPGAELFYADVGPRRSFGGTGVSGAPPIEPLFRATSRLAGGGEPWRVVVGDEAQAAFDTYAEDGQLIRRVHWAAAGRRPSARDVELAKEVYLQSHQRDGAAAERSLRAMPAVERTPVFDGLLVGEDGRVWVRRYSLPTDEEGLWWIFGTDGRLMSTAAIPSGYDILEAGKDYALLRATDDLGVERIELRALVAAKN